MGWVKEQLDDTPIVSQVSDVIHDVSEDTGFNDMAEKFYDDPIQAISDDLARFDDVVLQPVTGGVSDVLTDVDDFVNEEVPGGWPMVAALAIGGYHAYPYLAGTEAALAAEAAGTAGMDIAAFGGTGVGSGAGLSGSSLAGLEAAGSAGMDIGSFSGYDVAGLDNLISQQSSLYPMSGYNEAGLDALISQQSAAHPMSAYNEAGLEELIKQKSQPSLWQQAKEGYSALPKYGQKAISGAGQGALTNAAFNLATGRPITPEGVLISAAAGGVGGGVAGLTDSNWLGGLSATATNALLNRSFGPSAMSSAVPFALNGSSNARSSRSSESSGSSGSSGSSSAMPNPLTGQPLVGTSAQGSNSQILQQLKQLDPSLLARIAPHLSNNVSPLQMAPSRSPTVSPPAQATSGSSGQQQNPYSSLMQTMLLDKGPSSPSSGLSRTLMSSGLASLGGNVPGYKKGGSIQHKEQYEHVPEFITGSTGHYVKGKGDGQSDDIPAMLADGEYVFDADTVAALGNGSSDAGAKLLDHFRESLREHKRSAPSDKIPPKASPLTYMKEALSRHERK